VAAALDRLGCGPCLQMQDMWSHLDLADLWNAHHDGHPADWRTALAGWQSTVDWPGCWEWRELAELWPDAVVLLTARDPADWYDSVLASIYRWTAPDQDVGPPAMVSLLARIWDEDFGGRERVLDRDHAMACFERHNEDVRADCPPDRLIEWQAGDGWEPLCRALGVALPAEPFPHLNRRPA
jgi:hypothetical protein